MSEGEPTPPFPPLDAPAPPAPGIDGPNGSPPLPAEFPLAGSAPPPPPFVERGSRDAVAVVKGVLAGGDLQVTARRPIARPEYVAEGDLDATVGDGPHAKAMVAVDEAPTIAQTTLRGASGVVEGQVTTDAGRWKRGKRAWIAVGGAAIAFAVVAAIVAAASGRDSAPVAGASSSSPSPSPPPSPPPSPSPSTASAAATAPAAAPVAGKAPSKAPVRKPHPIKSTTKPPPGDDPFAGSRI